MGWFIAACITALLALVAVLLAGAIKVPEKDYDDMASAKKGARLAGGVLVVLTLAFLAFGSIYTQSVGQGVIVTRIGGAVIKADNTPGLGVKAPWDTAHKWDLFTRDISLSGEQEAKFDNGEITASQIATSVKSGEESGAQVWYDLDATYNIDNADLKALYSEYRDQDRFTRQVVYPAIQKAARSIPSGYTTTEFRGAGSVKAGDEIAAEINKRLSAYGVEITVATVKSVNFTKAVEASLSVVEEKQQQEESARADAAAKDVQNQQMIENATAQAKANKILTDNPTPEQKIALEQIKAYDAGTVFVVPQGSTPLVDTAK